MRFTFVCEVCNGEREASSVRLLNRLEGTIICTCATCNQETETRFATESNIETLKKENDLV